MTEGKLLLCGTSRSATGDVNGVAGENDSWVAIVDAQGQLDYSNTLGGSDFDFGFSAVLSPEGDIWVVGSTESNDGPIEQQKGQTDLMIYKIK